MKTSKETFSMSDVGRGARVTSVLRAACKQLLDTTEKHEMVEGEEEGIQSALGQTAEMLEMDPRVMSLLLLHSVAQAYIESKVPNGGQMPSVGNC